MEIIQDNPKTWTITKYKPLDVIMTGYNGMGAMIWRNYAVDVYDMDDEDCEEIDNVIFHADLVPTGMSKGQSSVLFFFSDTDGKHFYEAGAKAMATMVKAIADGNVWVNGNALHGKWTFRKMGSTISIWPCDIYGKEYKQ